MVLVSNDDHRFAVALTDGEEYADVLMVSEATFEALQQCPTGKHYWTMVELMPEHPSAAIGDLSQITTDQLIAALRARNVGVVIDPDGLG